MEIKIALTGKMRSGKDTVYEIFKDEIVSFAWANRFDPYIHKVAFGDALKKYAHMVFSDNTSDRKDRKLYQDFGQKMREIDPDVWVKAVNREVEMRRRFGLRISYHSSVAYGKTPEELEKLPNEGMYAPIITDLRQPNEYKYCKENGFYVIRVNASEDIRKHRMKQAGDKVSSVDLNHETESHIDTFEADYEILNDSNTPISRCTLELQVEEIIMDILKKEGVIK